MALKTKILYEIRQIQTDQILVLDKPASVWFQVLGAGGGFVIINNLYRLEPFQNSNSALGVVDWQLKLDNNVNELDVTNYTIRFAGASQLTIIIKYYEQPDK
jgi:hypothetical protein